MHFLNKMDIKGMTMVLCGSAQSFYTTFIIFPKNLPSVSTVSSMWHAIPCRVYLSQIVHVTFQHVTNNPSPLTTAVLEEFSHCVSTSPTPPVQDLMGGHSL